MKLSIVIVNYRGWKRLRECLESLQSLAELKFIFEVIVVDNHSNDNKLNTFKSDFNDFIFIENSDNNGFANGCNVGADHSKGEFILFLNPDTIVNHNAISRLMETAQLHPDIYILTCQQYNEHGKPTMPYGYFPGILTLTGLLRAIYKVTHKSFRTAVLKNNLTALFPDWVSGSLVLISKSKFEEVGKWSEDYWMYFEDVDLCKRIKNLGKEVALLTEVHIEHNHGGASRINIETKTLTKTETIISKHVYISRHFNGVKQFIMHSYMIIENLLLSLIISIFSLVTLFIFQKIKLYQKVYGSILKYYGNAILNKTWLSVRSKKYRPR